MKNTLSTVSKYLQNCKNFSIPQQFALINKKYSHMIVKKNLSPCEYYVVIRVKPTDYSREYLVKICHKKGQGPKVYIIKPNIYLNITTKKPPHVYEFDKNICRICLYIGEECSNDKKDEILVPWISEWLFYFEIWEITGEWKGGGHNADPSKNKEKF